MTLKNRHIVVVLLAVLALSCDDYLDEKPSKTTSVEIDSLGDLQALLNDYDFYAGEGAKELIYGTDDYAIDTLTYNGMPDNLDAVQAQYGTWDMDRLPTTEDRPYWPEEWGKIFNANLVLQKLEELPGDEKTKNNLKAEAHFIRAYSYFKLATVYCLPYTEENKSEMGLPIKESTDFEEPVERSSLKDTYSFIEDDLEDALDIKRTFSEINDKNRSWRASKVAVKAFAARYYLSLYNYEKSEKYAQEALDIYDNLRDYNSDMHFSSNKEEVTIFDPDPEKIEVKFPYTHDLQSDPTDRLEWGETYYYRYMYNPSWNYFPSQELIDLFNKEYDLRYKYHFVEEYSYYRGAVDPPFKYPGYIFFFESDILNGPSVPEMILTKAECQVRQGSWDEGIQTANQLREARMDANAPADVIHLEASSQTEALTKVLEERRREMPFIHRWFDVRRYNNNDEPSDDVSITRTFYPISGSSILDSEEPEEYTLDKGSRKFAWPLPETEIQDSDGRLEQNTY